MTKIIPKRDTAKIEGDFVAFLIGIRIQVDAIGDLESGRGRIGSL
jgi:hypothetical protein